eukprot:1178106-Prorocentrum_minimum.AAC.1
MVAERRKPDGVDQLPVEAHCPRGPRRGERHAPDPRVPRRTQPVGLARERAQTCPGERKAGGRHTDVLRAGQERVRVGALEGERAHARHGDPRGRSRGPRGRAWPERPREVRQAGIIRARGASPGDPGEAEEALHVRVEGVQVRGARHCRPRQANQNLLQKDALRFSLFRRFALRCAFYACVHLVSADETCRSLRVASEALDSEEGEGTGGAGRGVVGWGKRGSGGAHLDGVPESRPRTVQLQRGHLRGGRRPRAQRLQNYLREG